MRQRELAGIRRNGGVHEKLSENICGIWSKHHNSKVANLGEGFFKAAVLALFCKYEV
jgi:hypothetical protein